MYVREDETRNSAQVRGSRKYKRVRENTMICIVQKLIYALRQPTCDQLHHLTEFPRTLSSQHHERKLAHAQILSSHAKFCGKNASQYIHLACSRTTPNSLEPRQVFVAKTRLNIDCFIERKVVWQTLSSHRVRDTAHESRQICAAARVWFYIARHFPQQSRSNNIPSLTTHTPNSGARQLRDVAADAQITLSTHYTKYAQSFLTKHTSPALVTHSWHRCTSAVSCWGWCTNNSTRALNKTCSIYLNKTRVPSLRTQA